MNIRWNFLPITKIINVEIKRLLKICNESLHIFNTVYLFLFFRAIILDSFEYHARITRFILMIMYKTLMKILWDFLFITNIISIHTVEIKVLLTFQ